MNPKVRWGPGLSTSPRRISSPRSVRVVNPFCSWPRCAAVALATTTIAALLTHALWPYLEYTPFLLAFAAAMVSSRVGGRTGGLLAVALSVAAYEWFPLPLPTEGFTRLLLGFVVISSSFSHLVARRYEVEAELRASEARLSEAQELAHVGNWQWDLANGRMWWSDELSRICDVRLTSFPQTYAAYLELVHVDDRGAVEGAVQRCIEEGRPYEVEHRIVRPNGDVRVIVGHGRAFTDHGGRVTRIAGAALDITERKAVEEGLRRSEGRLQTIIDAEPACVKIISANGTLLDINRAGLAMVGAKDVSELVGQALVDFVYPADRAKVGKMLLSASHGEPARCEFRIVTLSGEERWVDSHLVPFEQPRDQRGTERTVLSVTSDVTERKGLEEQLRQAQKMEAVGRLAGGVAHDFNNVLMVIGGSAEMAMDELQAGDAMRAELQVICDAAASGASLTRQLLMFSRRQAVEPRLIELNAVVRSVEKMLHRLVGEDILLTVALESRPTSVLADVNHIEQILMNLAVNARDAMPRGGTLSICTKLVEPEGDPRQSAQGSVPATRVGLTVSDTGTGMDADVKSHLFEPFFTTKPTGEGTGLGLATVYGIVQQSGGTIEVTSEPGQGTTIRILLPLADAALAVAPELIEAHSSQRGSETVLVVEDEIPVRDLVSKILRRHGYTVVNAGCLREALTEIWSRPAAIDLLLTDVVMPSDSGPQLAETLCRHCPGMAVLFISGHGDDALRSYGVPESGITLLHKPFSSNALLVKVREALDRHRTARRSGSHV